jgi:hypothetical protein
MNLVEVARYLGLSETEESLRRLKAALEGLVRDGELHRFLRVSEVDADAKAETE